MSPQTDDQPSTRRIQNPDRQLRQSTTILVVDDEAIVRDVAAAMLKTTDYNVLIAESGNQAVKLFGEVGDSVSLVILDMAMPGMDGKETLEALQKLRPDVRVILSSGHTEEVAISTIGSAGTVGFLHKPYKVKNLLAAVREALET